MSAAGSWNITIRSPMDHQEGTLELELRASVDGDVISGTVKPGVFGNATFQGRRL